MKPVIIIAIAFVLLFPITVHAELDDLKKLIPDYYNYQEESSGESHLGTFLVATIEKNEGNGMVTISQFSDSNQMWDVFKEQRLRLNYVEGITDLSATCYEGWSSEQVKSISCIKNDYWIFISTSYGETKSTMKQIINKIDGGVSLSSITDNIESNGGGCLIATATYGSELAPQVQQLRELRNNSLLQTESGTNFMNSFNDFYYSFSPVIADYERENPVFKEAVKITLTPLISSLSILNYVDMDSESSVLGYGISLIVLNGLMYVGIPIAGIIVVRNRF